MRELHLDSVVGLQEHLTDAPFRPRTMTDEIALIHFFEFTSPLDRAPRHSTCKRVYSAFTGGVALSSRTARQSILCVLAMALLTLSGCRSEVGPPPPATNESPATAPPTKRVVGPLSEADAQALATMNDRLKEYVKLHVEIERKLPKLPDDATPQQIDNNQRAFERMMRDARRTAQQGDIFTPEAQPVIKRLLVAVFDGPEGKQLKASIMDENPVNPSQMELGVNARYPDIVPLTTVPPEVLQTLPKLTEDLEYRFVGDWLILLDQHAHIIADYIPDAVP